MNDRSSREHPEKLLISENRKFSQLGTAPLSARGTANHQPGHAVFHIDQAVLRPPEKKSSHWSIAWSDLMMTMFVLFLSLFVYQATHEKFLRDNNVEILAGDTKEALDLETQKKNDLPFELVSPTAPLITAGTIKKIETVKLHDLDLDLIFPPQEFEEINEDRRIPSLKGPISPPQRPIIAATFQVRESLQTVLQPDPIQLQETSGNSVNALFAKSQTALDTFQLNDFASIDLIPDKALRIVLTGDLLFETGHAALSIQAIHSLEKIASSLNDSDYQIHIEGHTDNIPIRSEQYANNWELSLARAKAVAVFLIEDMKMTPDNIVISGYSSYRPVVPNSSDENRSKNRRVEIVVSKPDETSRETDLNNYISANF